VLGRVTPASTHTTLYTNQYFKNLTGDIFLSSVISTLTCPSWFSPVHVTGGTGLAQSPEWNILLINHLHEEIKDALSWYDQHMF